MKVIPIVAMWTFASLLGWCEVGYAQSGGLACEARAYLSGESLLWEIRSSLIRDLDLHSGIAYYADSDAGLRIVDATDPRNPVLLSTWPTDGNAEAVSVSGSIACVAKHHAGLEIVDVSDPTSPALLYSSDEFSWIHDVVLVGDTAYFGAQWEDSGILIFDLSDPAAPSQVGSYTAAGGVMHMDLHGSMLFVLGGAGLSILDISEPTTPTLIGNLSYAPGRRITVSERHAYVADHRDLHVIDVSDASNPNPITTHRRIMGFDFHALAVGEKLYLSRTGGFDGLFALDMRDPLLLQYVGYCGTFRGGPLDAEGTTLVCGTQLMDHSKIRGWSRLGSVELDSSWGGVVSASGSTACVGASENLFVVDVSDPLAPVEVGRWRSASFRPTDIAVAGTIAFATGGAAGLYAFDVSDPTDIARISRIRTRGDASAFALVGNIAYIADAEAGLTVVDVSDVTAPMIIGSLDTPGTASNVHVADEVAYVADGDSGLQIVDVSDPASPRALGQVEGIGTTTMDVGVSDGLVYILEREDGVRIFDVRDPGDPQFVGEYLLSDWWGTNEALIVDGDDLFLLQNSLGLLLIDVSEPTAPAMRGVTNWASGGRGLHLEDGMAIVCGGSSGDVMLRTVDLADCPECRVDLTGDGVVDSRDFVAFLGLWAAQDDDADWNGDSQFDTRDFIAFLGDWVVGC